MFMPTLGAVTHSLPPACLPAALPRLTRMCRWAQLLAGSLGGGLTAHALGGLSTAVKLGRGLRLAGRWQVRGPVPPPGQGAGRRKQKQKQQQQQAADDEEEREAGFETPADGSQLTSDLLQSLLSGQPLQAHAAMLQSINDKFGGSSTGGGGGGSGSSSSSDAVALLLDKLKLAVQRQQQEQQLVAGAPGGPPGGDGSGGIITISRTPAPIAP